MLQDRSLATKEKILTIVLGNTDGGLSISKVAERAGISVATASKFVHILAAERKVKIERFGDMKLVHGAGR
jgi:DNA-binding MurR/RpiR family transcriptional regulator